MIIFPYGSDFLFFFLTYHIDDDDVDNDELIEVCGS